MLMESFEWFSLQKPFTSTQSFKNLSKTLKMQHCNDITSYLHSPIPYEMKNPLQVVKPTNDNHEGQLHVVHIHWLSFICTLHGSCPKFPNVHQMEHNIHFTCDINFASSTIWPLKNPFNSKQMIQIWAMQFGKIKSLVTFVASMSISRFSSIS